MKIDYARVSTKDQSLSMQIDALKAAGCTQIHEEIASGAKTARPVLDEVMRNLREEDTLVIWKLDRLGRNLAHLIHQSARARGRKGGRPKGISQSAIQKAAIAEALYKNGTIPVKKIAEQLGISKTTLYLYLRLRNVPIGSKTQEISNS